MINMNINIEVVANSSKINVGSSFLKQQLLMRGIEAKPRWYGCSFCPTHVNSKHHNNHHCRYSILQSSSMSTKGRRNQSWSRLKPANQDIFEEMGLRSKGDKQ